MAMNLICNYSAVVSLNAVDHVLGAPNDQVFGVQGGLYQIPRASTILGICVAMDAPTRCRLDIPSLRTISLPHVDPMNGVLPLANRPAVWLPGNTGPRVQATEEYRILVDRLGIADGPAFAATWISDTPVQPVTGNMFKLRMTTSIVTGAGLWNNGDGTLAERLPFGNYQVVGLQTYGTGVFASRLIFSDSANRPGNVGRSAQGTWGDGLFTNGRMGLLGTFQNYTVPRLEIFGHATTGTQVTYLDIIKV